MPSKAKNTKRNNNEYKEFSRIRIIAYSAFVIGILSLIFSFTMLLILVPSINSAISLQHTSSQPAQQSNITFGRTLAGIDQPLNSTELSVINNAPDSYYQTAGEMFINGTLNNTPYPGNANPAPALILNNKPSVFYLGSITCIFCGENRWAMALALSRFGSFSKLFIGYSSFGDGDLPTLYWTHENYNVSGDSIGNYYSSNIINFISIDDTNPITKGFQLNSIPTIHANILSYDNQTYAQAYNYFANLSQNKTTTFTGTPYTVWGNYQFPGADAVVFGNSTPSSNYLPLEYMTHAQVLSQLANPTDQFAQSEYAAADVYVAAVCKSINNTAPACTAIPAIAAIETAIK